MELLYVCCGRRMPGTPRIDIVFVSLTVNNATTFALCIFGPIAGLVQRYTHRYKTLQVTGLSIRLM